MIATVAGLLGITADAMRWLARRPAPSANPVDRRAAEQVARLIADPGAAHDLRGWSAVNAAWRVRQAALSAYRAQLTVGPSIDVVLEALLHMHHNRALGIDRDQEAACRRLARRAALSWLAHLRGAQQ